MGDTTLVPFCLETNNVILPKFSGQVNNKYIYNLFSPFNGRDLKETVKYLPINIEIVVPVGVIVHLKQVHFEENGSYVRDERLDRGLVQFQEGKQYKLKCLIPKQMDRRTLLRGQIIGSLIFDRQIELIRYWPSINQTNLLRYKRLNGNNFKLCQIEGSAGIDLPSADKYELAPNQKIKIQTNLAIALPKGFYGQIMGRSGIADKYGVGVLGGLIDNSYRGEIFVILFNHGNEVFNINPGDRIAQLVLAPCTKSALVECELDSTIRGKNGLGSTGLEPITKATAWNSSIETQPISLSFDDLVGTDTISLSSDKSFNEVNENYPVYDLF